MSCHVPLLPRCALLAWLLVQSALVGCAGYQLGTHSLYRTDVRTVYVPMFESESFRRQLGERLTEAVVKEIESRTPYKVVHYPEADTVLTGRIVSENKRVIAEDAFDVPRDIETDLTVQVAWYDRRGELLMQPANFSLAPLSFSAAVSTNFVPEGGQSLATAHQEAISRLARQIVSQMEIPW